MMDLISSRVFLSRLSDSGIVLDFSKARHFALINELLLFLGIWRKVCGSTYEKGDQ